MKRSERDEKKYPVLGLSKWLDDKTKRNLGQFLELVGASDVVAGHASKSRGRVAIVNDATVSRHQWGEFLGASSKFPGFKSPLVCNSEGHWAWHVIGIKLGLSGGSLGVTHLLGLLLRWGLLELPLLG